MAMADGLGSFAADHPHMPPQASAHADAQMLNMLQRATGSRRDKKDCPEWSDPAIDALIDCYLDKYMRLQRGNLRTCDWQDIVRRLNEKCGCEKSRFTYSQCKNKLDSMKKRYKIEKERRMATGGKGRRWKWFAKVDKIMGKIPKVQNSPEGIMNGDELDVMSPDDELALPLSEDVAPSLHMRNHHEDSIVLYRNSIGKDKLIMHGMKFCGPHGVYSEDKKHFQKIIVDMDLWLDADKALQPEHSVSYKEVYRLVCSIVEGLPQSLLQSLANSIACGVLKEFTTITDVRVKVGIPHIDSIDYVGMEVFRSSTNITLQ